MDCCKRRATPRARSSHVGAVALRAHRAPARARRRHGCASAVHIFTTDSSRTMVSGLAQWIACWAHNVITRDTQRSLDRDQDPLFSLRENSGSPFGPLPGTFGRPSGALRDPAGDLRSSSGPFGRSGAAPTVPDRAGARVNTTSSPFLPPSFPSRTARAIVPPHGGGREFALRARASFGLGTHTCSHSR